MCHFREDRVLGVLCPNGRSRLRSCKAVRRTDDWSHSELRSYTLRIEVERGDGWIRLLGCLPSRAASGRLVDLSRVIRAA
jgi:hypothetical protein